MESPDSLLGLAQCLPEQEVIALSDEAVFPKAMTGQWRCVRIDIPASGATVIDGLATWNREGLLVGIGVRPSGYKDIAGLAQWLSEAPYEVDIDVVLHLLESAGAASRHRTAYLLQVSGNREAAHESYHRGALGQALPRFEGRARRRATGHRPGPRRMCTDRCSPVLDIGTSGEGEPG